MIKRLFAYFAKRSHDVRIQLLCATIYGLLSVFGVFGTIAIILKARKVSKKQAIPVHGIVIMLSILYVLDFLTGTLAHFITYRHWIYTEVTCWSVTMILIYINHTRKAKVKP